MSTEESNASLEVGIHHYWGQEMNYLTGVGHYCMYYGRWQWGVDVHLVAFETPSQIATAVFKFSPLLFVDYRIFLKYKQLLC